MVSRVGSNAQSLGGLSPAFCAINTIIILLENMHTVSRRRASSASDGNYCWTLYVMFESERVFAALFVGWCAAESSNAVLTHLLHVGYNN